MWIERNSDNPNYARMTYVWNQHHARYKRYVREHGLPCQACECRGKFGWDSIHDGPADPCGWCEMTGKVTRWMRGVWLRYMKAEKRDKAAKRKTVAA